MNLSKAEWALWVAGFIGYCLVLTALLETRRWRRFPALSAYVLYLLIFTVCQFAVQRRIAWNPTAYWIDVGIDFLLQLGLLTELARLSFRPSGRLWIPEAKRFLLRGAAFAVGISLAFALAIRLQPGGSTEGLWKLRVDIFTSLLVCSMILLYAVATDRLALQQMSDVTAIGRGFASWAGIALLSDVARLYTTWLSAMPRLNLIPQIAWVAMLAYWGWVLGCPTRPVVPVRE